MIRIGKIVEYDIRSANVSCLKALGHMSIKYYESLMSLPKLKRNIAVGVAMRDGKIDSKKRTESIKYFVDLFISSNSLDMEKDVLTIANDAVWTFNVKPTSTEFSDGVVKFCKKQSYDMIISNDKVKNIYYNLQEDKLMVRGFDRDIDIDIDPFFNRIKNIMYYIMNDYNKSDIGSELRSMNGMNTNVDAKTVKQFIGIILNSMFIYGTESWESSVY